MGNGNSSARKGKGDGVPFVTWTSAANSIPGDNVSGNDAKASVSRLPTTSAYHFAEPACYRYDKVPRVVTAQLVATNPPRADGPISNRDALVGSIALVERGGRIRFPDIIRKLLQAGVVGVIFIERKSDPGGTQSLFDGFHSSGRQSVPIPIVLLSKYHADQLLQDNPARVSIHLLSSDEAIKYVVADDIYFAVATAARAGELELLKHLLYADTTGSVLRHLPKAVALCDAAENGHVDCIEVLHGFGISLDEQKPTGTTALMVACSAGNVEAARALLMFGASLDLEDVHGLTALMIATRDGKLNCVKLLVRKGAQVNLSRKRNRGTTALHIAARGGQEDCLALLLREGAELEIQSPNFTTALMEAARAGNLECVKILVNAGANLEAKDRDGNTAESLARASGHTDIEDFLQKEAESESVKDHRRQIDDVITRENSTLADLLLLAKTNNISVDILKRELLREPKSKSTKWLEQPRIVYEVFRCITLPVPKTSSGYLYTGTPFSSSIYRERLDNNTEESMQKKANAKKEDNGEQQVDSTYGNYGTQYFCCEIALWYSRRIFQNRLTSKNGDSSAQTRNKKLTQSTTGSPRSRSSSNALPNTLGDLDLERSYTYLKVFFNFLCVTGPLDDVLVVLFCKVLNEYILSQQLGELILKFLAEDGSSVVPWLAVHIGLDSIRDSLVWLLYSDMSPSGQVSIRRSRIFDILFARLCSWQRTLSWGVGTNYQRDSVENIASLVNYIIYPPSVYIMGNVATFVENTDNTLPLITDQYFPHLHNELLKSLLLFFSQSPGTSNGSWFDTILELGYAEIYRQATQKCDIMLKEGGALSIILMLMSTLGYHKTRRDTTGIDDLLKAIHPALIASLAGWAEKFTRLCLVVVSAQGAVLGGVIDFAAPTGNHPYSIDPGMVINGQNLTIKSKGSTLLYIVEFLKRCIFLQSGTLDGILANFGCMPTLLSCYMAYPNNSLLHHELTDIVRFVLLDPDRKRLPSCPLLNSLFMENASILDFVITSYNAKNVQYNGHLTTIANSIFTLTNTPIQKSEKESQMNITCQEVVRQYASKHTKWLSFESILNQQNELEMLPLGERNAPLCSGCLNLKEHSLDYVNSTISTSDIEYSGHLETIFTGVASHYCKVNSTEAFITGFMYKKDKIHDHIPIPEPTPVSSFIQYPVPMPFHALTFTITYFGLCRKCDKLWYCDTLQAANWTTRMKWVIPTSIRKWYTFGVTEGPGAGAHGFQFSTKGYKNFIVLIDTWGRQEQWMEAISGAILGNINHSRMRIDAENAMAIEIDNEVNSENIDLVSARLPRVKLTSSTSEWTRGTSNSTSTGSLAPAANKNSEKGNNKKKRLGKAPPASTGSLLKIGETIERPRSHSTNTKQPSEIATTRKPTSLSGAPKSEKSVVVKNEMEESKGISHHNVTRIVETSEESASETSDHESDRPTSLLTKSVSAELPYKNPNGRPPKPNAMNMLSHTATPNDIATRRRQRELDLKKFQPDTQTFAKILSGLQMAATAQVNAQDANRSRLTQKSLGSIPPVIFSDGQKLKGIPMKHSRHNNASHFDDLGSNASLSVRHVASTPNFAAFSLKDNNEASNN